MGFWGALFGSGEGAPRCSDCGSTLGGGESILGGGAVVFSTRPAGAVQDDYSLFNGSICRACRKVICMSCLGSKVDRCPHCGGDTVPAYKRYLREL